LDIFPWQKLLLVSRRIASLAVVYLAVLDALRSMSAALCCDCVNFIRERSCLVWREVFRWAMLACSIALFFVPTLSAAQSGSDAGTASLSVEDIAIELLNPVTSLRSVAFDFERQTYQGSLPLAGEQDTSRMVITPSWPIKLSNGKNLLLRARIPINSGKPAWTPGDNSGNYDEFLLRQLPDIDESNGVMETGHDHLGDISLDVGYGGVGNSGGISMFGLSVVLPTSDDESVSRNQALLGPEIALGRVTDWGIFGVRAKHLVNILGEGHQKTGDYDTSETTLKLFFAYSLGNGWQIESNPEILYDWEGIDDNQWNVPVGAGISKTSMFGQVPLKIAVELQNYVVSTDRLAPEWLLRFSIVPVIPDRNMD